MLQKLGKTKDVGFLIFHKNRHSFESAYRQTYTICAQHVKSIDNMWLFFGLIDNHRMTYYYYLKWKHLLNVQMTTIYHNILGLLSLDFEKGFSRLQEQFFFSE